MENQVCLDTDVLIDILRAKPNACQWLLEHESCDALAMTMVTLFELYRGACKSTNYERQMQMISALRSRMRILEFSHESAWRAAHVGARLESEGKALESRDLFTGAIALEHGFALKTRNARHFSRIPGLTVL
ncbi:type II toxin-antitoxin system VapC family toxin [Candidatus Woesearchaeota archaeon]|nr:type II toxin-antitoxin system VapC family toxin [Candidatus Woesearchaeota archaeon]